MGIVIGDEHSESVKPPHWGSVGYPGLTLREALDKRLPSYVPNGTDKVLFKLGENDIRHKLCLEERPINATDELITDYILQLQMVADSGVMVFAAHVMPQAKDERGPFEGDHPYRQHIGFVFNSALSAVWNGVLGYEGYSDDELCLPDEMLAGTYGSLTG